MSDFFLRDPVQIKKKLSLSLITFSVSARLHIQITGQLLDLSIPIRMYGSPVIYLLSSFPEKTIFDFFQARSKPLDYSFFMSVIYYGEFLPENMHAVHVLHLFSLS